MNSDDIVDIGEEHHKAGRLQEAESHYRKALEIDPGHPGALFYLANIAFFDGRRELAKQLIEILLSADPGDAEAWHLLGMIALHEESFPRATECFHRAVAIQPAYAQAHFSLGNVFSAVGELDTALAAYQQALALNSEFGAACVKIANIYALQNRNDLAINNYRRAIALNGGDLEAHVNLANTLMIYNQYAESKVAFEQALSVDPNCAEIYRNLGNLLIAMGDVNAGIATLQKSIALQPEDSELRSNLALALFGLGELPEAIECLQKAIKEIPNAAALHSILLCLHQYLPDYSREHIFSEHAAFGERFETPLREHQIKHLKPTDANRRLRVGFVSPDLYSHPVGYFLEGVLRELYQRNEIDIIIYAANTASDSVTDRLRAASHKWLMITALSDDAAVQRIRDDKIDILIDLSGHTASNRLPVFARKPAPVQVTWLGYWETTGLRAIDYILCDRHSVREGEENYYVETPWRLPHTRLCFTLPSENIFVSSLPALSNGYITFGCFNNLTKMTDRVVSIWARILKRTQHSRLLIKSASFADSSICARVKARFAAEGIAADRLELEINSPRREYFAVYNRVDIALDPFPFPGGTTSVEGIWMGVPMITLSGSQIVSRQGDSILRNISLHDWIASDEDSYVELAVEKAADLPALAKLRSELRERMEKSPLCDAKLFAINIEDAFKQMWAKYCQDI